MNESFSSKWRLFTFRTIEFFKLKSSILKKLFKKRSRTMAIVSWDCRVAEHQHYRNERGALARKQTMSCWRSEDRSSLTYWTMEHRKSKSIEGAHLLEPHSKIMTIIKLSARRVQRSLNEVQLQTNKRAELHPQLSISLSAHSAFRCRVAADCRHFWKRAFLIVRSNLANCIRQTNRKHTYTRIL